MNLVAACSLRVSVLSFLCVFPGPHSAPAQSQAKDVAKQIDSAFSGLASADTPGFAVLVKKNGKIVFEKATVCEICAATP